MNYNNCFCNLNSFEFFIAAASAGVAEEATTNNHTGE